jgi:hypothetical protein
MDLWTIAIKVLNRQNLTVRHNALIEIEALWQELETVFGAPLKHLSDEREILNLRQDGDVGLYNSRFQSLCLALGWPDSGAVQLMYQNGLKDNIRDKMINIVENIEELDLKNLMQCAARAEWTIKSASSFRN